MPCDLLVCAGRIFAASGLVLAVHTWMSLRFRSFAPVLALGILATLVTIALNSGDVEVWPWFPWSLPFRAARGFGQAVQEPVLLALGALGGLAAPVLAGWEMTRRDVFWFDQQFPKWFPRSYEETVDSAIRVPFGGPQARVW